MEFRGRLARVAAVRTAGAVAQSAILMRSLHFTLQYMRVRSIRGAQVCTLATYAATWVAGPRALCCRRCLSCQLVMT